MKTPDKKRMLSTIPEILYEAPNYPGEKVSPIPYVVIPKDKDMPVGLFLMRYTQTGEYDVGSDGKPEEVMDGPHPHMFVDFAVLEQVLEESFPDIEIGGMVDKIRVGLGMKPKAVAVKAGEEMLARVVDKANELMSEKIKEAAKAKVAPSFELPGKKGTAGQ